MPSFLTGFTKRLKENQEELKKKLEKEGKLELLPKVEKVQSDQRNKSNKPSGA